MSIFLGLFWVICALLTLSLGLYLILVNHVLDGSVGIIFIILHIGCLYLAISNFCNKGETELSTKQDVIDGKAYYQETQVITGNDTIKTYDYMKTNKARVPQVGEKLHFFDDGKVSDSRHYLAVVTHVLTPDQAKLVFVDQRTFCESHSLELDENKRLSLLDIHTIEIKYCDWIFAPETDYFIACSIPEYDDHIIWFVRTKDTHQSWFSMDIQTNWQGGYLDVDGERYQRMVDEGYTYSERI